MFCLFMFFFSIICLSIPIFFLIFLSNLHFLLLHSFLRILIPILIPRSIFPLLFALTSPNKCLLCPRLLIIRLTFFHDHNSFCLFLLLSLC